MNFWSPHADRHHPRVGTAPERYVLRLEEAGPFLGLDGAEGRIREVNDPGRAFQFHTHQRALAVARELGALDQRRISVIKLL